MQVLIVSDSHGVLRNLKTAIERTKPDLVLHLGDCEQQEKAICKLAPCDVVFVRGNCDFASVSPNDRVVEVGNERVFMTHGHLHGVNRDNTGLAAAAAANDCGVALYGHTHVPEITREDGIVVVNPGSVSYPRQEGHHPTAAVCDVDRFGKLHFNIVRID